MSKSYKSPIYKRWYQLKKQSSTCLCIGLDPDIAKLPSGYTQNIDGVNHFLKDIIDCTLDKCISYKPNISFYEALGIKGLQLLQDIISHIDERLPVIVDAKRGDIGNTSAKQAQFIFDECNADATTLHPYMGLDSLEPFFNYKDKFNFVLGLTSNPGSVDFEKLRCDDHYLYEKVIQSCATWNTKFHNIGLVVGATQEEMKNIRASDGTFLYLIPGVGAQGGLYEDAYQYGKNNDGLALISVSRSILYAAQHKNDLKSKTQSAIRNIIGENDVV